MFMHLLRRCMAATLISVLAWGSGAFLAPARAVADSPPAPAPVAYKPDNPAAADAWFYSQRKAPGGITPAAAYAHALSQAQGLRTQGLAPRGAAGTLIATPAWVNLGPKPVIEPGIGPASGRISSILLAGGSLYIGAAGGGVWRNDSPGVWTPLTDNQPSLAIGALAADPNHPNVIYAGTGEFHQSNDSFYGVGLLKTTDGGATWSVLGGDTFAGTHISAIVVSPVPTVGLLYVASDAGLYKSVDGGQTFTPIKVGAALGERISALVMSPTTHVLYAAAMGDGVYASTDFGTNWTPAIGLPTGPKAGNTALAVAPSNDNIMYASVADPFGGLQGFYVSSDAGHTWTSKNLTFDYFSPAFYYGSGTGAQGWYDNAIAVHPTNPQMVAVGGIGFALTFDGGATWASAPSTPGKYDLAGPNGVHPDFHALVFDSSGNLYMGNDGGMWERTTGGTYLNLNQTLSITQNTPGLSQFNNGAMVLAGAQDNGTDLYMGSPAWSDVAGGDGGFTAIDPTNAKTFYAEYQGGDIIKTTDGGATFRHITPPNDPLKPLNWVVPFMLDPNNPATIYAGGQNLWKSTDGGSTWVNLTKVLPSSDPFNYDDVSAMAVAPSNSQVIYSGWNSGKLQMSTNGGATWRTISPNTQRWITSIAVSPTDPYTVYVTLSGFAFPQYSFSIPYVYMTSRSSDAVVSWQDITGNLPAAPVNALVLQGPRLIVGSDVGVFASTNNGQSWTALGSALPNTQVVGLTLSPEGTLFASTHGRGVWSLAVGAAPQAATTVSSISPTAGSPGTTVTITGSGFTGATAVYFGLVPAASFTVNSDSQITAVSPLGGGAVDVTVAAAGGRSPQVAADRFTYPGTGSIVGISPARAPSGTAVTITGSGFATTPGKVLFQDEVLKVYDATSGITNWTDTSITVKVPAMLPGTGAVTVLKADHTTTNAALFVTTAGPTLTAATPASGQVGTTVTISGAGFGTVAGSLYFAQGSSQVPVTPLQWTDTSIQATVPTVLSPGGATISVALYGSSSISSNALSFMVLGQPVIVPVIVPVGGGSGSGSSDQGSTSTTVNKNADGTQTTVVTASGSTAGANASTDSGVSISVGGGNDQVQMDPGTVAQPTSGQGSSTTSGPNTLNVQVNVLPTTSLPGVNGSSSNATQPAAPLPSSVTPQAAMEITATVGPAAGSSSTSQQVHQLAKPATVTFTLTPAALAPGTTAFVAYYNTALGIWVQLPSTVNSATGQVTAKTGHFTTFAAFTSSASRSTITAMPSAAVASPMVSISGTAPGGTTITAYNGTVASGSLTQTTDGAWSLPVGLQAGSNALTVVASQTGGKLGIAEGTVTYVPVPATVTVKPAPDQALPGATVTISGVVKDAYGQPVSGAVVALTTSAGSLSQTSVTTGADGSYLATMVAPTTPGMVLLRASTGTTVSGTGALSVLASVNTPTTQTATNVVEPVDTSFAAVRVATADDAAVLVLPLRGLRTSTTVTITQVAPQVLPALPARTTLLSPVWSVDVGGASFAAAASLTLRYQAVAPFGLVGLYTLVGDRWQYYAGSSAAGALQAAIARPGTWAVLAAPPFADLAPDFWAFRQVTLLGASGVLSGFPDGTFQPNQAVTHAQFVRMVLGVLGIKPQVMEKQPFSDVDPQAWYAGYLDVAAQTGIYTGRAGMAAPDVPITRQEVAVILMRAVSYGNLRPTGGAAPAELPTFADLMSTDATAQQAVRSLAQLGLMRGYSDGTFRPTRELSRAEAAVLMMNLLQLQQSQDFPPPM